MSPFLDGSADIGGGEGGGNLSLLPWMEREIDKYLLAWQKQAFEEGRDMADAMKAARFNRLYFAGPIQGAPGKIIKMTDEEFAKINAQCGEGTVEWVTDLEKKKEETPVRAGAVPGAPPPGGADKSIKPKQVTAKAGDKTDG